jgi:hypothetical protein
MESETIQIIYPIDTNSFFRGTVYQVKDIINKEWSDEE